MNTRAKGKRLFLVELNDGSIGEDDWIAQYVRYQKLKNSPDLPRSISSLGTSGDDIIIAAVNSSGAKLPERIEINNSSGSTVPSIGMISPLKKENKESQNIFLAENLKQ